ncbi:MAG: hypothetical protein R2729_13150 [Bryobacteraceae bacterium]
MTISRRAWIPALLGGGASIGRMLGQAVEDLHTPVGQIAGHAVGRGIVYSDGSIEVLAYYPFFTGVGSELWATSERTEKSAFFALRTGKFKLQIVQNGRVYYSRLIPLVGDGLVSSIYYHPTPNRSFDRPESFSDGQVIVTLKNRGGSIMAIDGGELTYSSTALVLDTVDFNFQGRRLNLADTGAKAYTVTLHGPAPSIIDLQEMDGVLTLPVAGSFVVS